MNLRGGKIIQMYERDDFCSYFIIKPEAGKVLEYQVEMITNNCIPGLLAMDLRRKNNEEYLYYKITSKIPLSQLLSRKKINKSQLLNILNQITETMLSGVNYLLYNKCYILKEEFIYVDPAAFKLDMVYVPVIMEEDINQNLRKLIIDLIINATYTEDDDSGDGFIQKIINYLKGDTFNIAGLNRLLKQLNEGNHEEENEINKCKLNDINKIEDTISEVTLPSEINDLDEQESVESHSKNNTCKSHNFKLLEIGIASQIILLVLFMASKKLLESLNGNIKTTYAATVLIIIAIDALIIKNLLDRRRTIGSLDESSKGRKSKEILGEKENNPQADKTNNNLNSKPENMTFENDLDDESDSDYGSYPEYGNKTVLLSVKKEQKPYIINMTGSTKEEIPINKKDFLIGRLDDMVDYVIKNNTVGKIHAQITTCENKYYLKDLNSSNGTLLNDIKLECNVENEIKDGDRVTFANSDYLFVLR